MLWSAEQRAEDSTMSSVVDSGEFVFGVDLDGVVADFLQGLKAIATLQPPQSIAVV